MKEFFKRVNELLREDATGILDIIIAEGIEIKDKEWAERMIATQAQRRHKEKKDDIEDIEPEEDNAPEPLDDDEVRVDAPAMEAVGSYLFRRVTHPYRMRLVTPNYSIIY